MEKKNKLISIAVAAAAIIAIICIIAVNSGKKNDSKSTLVPANGQQTSDNAGSGSSESGEAASEKSAAESAAEEDKAYTPTFMYFVSANDTNYEATNAIIAELQEQYEGKVTFDIRSVDEHPEYNENYSVNGNTPFLIMLNTANDPCAFLPSCDDKEQLENAIKKAFE